MKGRMLLTGVVAGGYLMMCAAGFAQNTTLNHGNDSESSGAAIEAHDIAFSPVPADTRNSTEKVLPLAPVPKSDANSTQSLREQESPYLLLTYKDSDSSKQLANSHEEAPTRVFGPGWNTNIDALRNNPNAPGPGPAYVSLKTLGHAIARLL